jgi:PKD repeat protein
MRKAWQCAVLGSILLGVCGSAVAAAQWVVAQDGTGGFRSIQGGINASSYGDVVYVSPGVYEEHVTLKDGVRVVGAGVANTIIRYAYGFDEVVRAQQMSSGSLEKVTVERLASVLPGPVVLADSAAAALIDCIVTGGQGSGVEVVDSTSMLTLERVQVTGNVGHGVFVHDGARVVLTDCVLDANSGSGLVLGASSAARVSGTLVAENRRCGVVLEGNADLDAERSTIGPQPEWGVLALGEARIVLVDVDFLDNEDGGLRVAGTVHASIARVLVRNGGVGVDASGSARVDATELRIVDVNGDGLAISEAATLAADHAEVIGAGENGVLFDTSGVASLLLSSIVESGADGVLVRSGRPSVRQTILAYNRGAGVRVDASQSMSADADVGYNAVWGNGESYVGTQRPATDVAESPDFVNLARGNLTLLPGSPCLGAGPAWTNIGAGADAASLTPFSFELVPAVTDGWLGATWTSSVRVGAFPAELQALDLGCRWSGDSARLDLTASLLGTWGVRATAHAEGAVRWPSVESGKDRASLAYGAEGVLEGVRSWASAWADGRIETPGLSVGSRVSFAWPSGEWTADLTAGLNGPLVVSVAVGTANLSLRSLLAEASTRVALGGGAVSLVGRIALLPDVEATLETQWTKDAEQWRARLAFKPQADAWAFVVSVGDAAARVEIQARRVAAALTDGELSLAFGGDAARVRAGLALDSEGARFRVGIELTLNGLFRGAPNEPPIPAFRTTPPDPEAGKPLHFLADESSDPDGEIRQIWWDFGDGSAAEGWVTDHVYEEPGTYDVVLTVSDDDGAVSALTSSVRIWPADTTPVAAFSAYPVSASGVRLPRPLREGDLVRLDAGDASDPDGIVVEYAWDVGADGSFDVTSAEATATVGPLDAGSHPITLRVIDDSGRADAVMQVVVVDKSEPPRAGYAYTPPTPAVRDPVYFTDRSTDTDGEIRSWEWDFGDGATSHEQSPIHRYERVGRYDVALRVVDDAGLTSTATQPLDVSAVPQIVDVGEVWAVLIGISDYAEVKDLQYAAADASSVARWVLDAGVEQDHIRLLLDREGPQSDLDGLAARRATLVNVREALGWLRRVAKPNDLVLIHFSGHGFQGADDDGDERDGVDEFFVLWDTVDAAKEDTALRDDEFGEALDRIESQHVVVFFDGCYSGGLSRSLPSSTRPVSDKQDLFSDFSVEGRLVFSASAESQDAFESDELKHGIFTYYLLEGLRGAADATGDGRVTAWELYEYVARTVPARAKLERNALQQPQLLGEGEVRVLLAETSHPPTADFSYRPGSPYAGGAMAFTDQSTGDRAVRSWRWTFGDGTTSDEPDPVHTYEKPGEYSVELRVTDRTGVEGAVTHAISVGPPGTVVVVDAPSDRVVISLGRENGVGTGDRFEVPAEPSPDAVSTQLEVVELIESGLSACRLVQGRVPAVGSAVRPLPPDSLAP